MSASSPNHSTTCATRAAATHCYWWCNHATNATLFQRTAELCSAATMCAVPRALQVDATAPIRCNSYSKAIDATNGGQSLRCTWNGEKTGPPGAEKTNRQGKWRGHVQTPTHRQACTPVRARAHTHRATVRTRRCERVELRHGRALQHGTLQTGDPLATNAMYVGDQRDVCFYYAFYCGQAASPGRLYKSRDGPLSWYCAGRLCRSRRGRPSSA